MVRIGFDARPMDIMRLRVYFEQIHRF